VGDNAELRDDEVVLQEQVAANPSTAGIDRLFDSGRFAGAYARGFGEQAQVFDDQANLVSALLALQVGSGALTLLVKGSRSAGMDRVVKQLLMKGTA
ncbi:MAG: UDP-N-acetylmuramoyl-tripeptide--D-alanyl-D-alanine ligase, partial [Gammaproteobacteria bacterium]|nr:UDP-N-acetylmuramoyl-tripeptide--D-alanyl-D-alanine ligase [Gammaproteobacteria bacterium]